MMPYYLQFLAMAESSPAARDFTRARVHGRRSDLTDVIEELLGPEAEAV